MSNLALLSQEERRQIELDRQACLLLYKLRTKQLTRAQVARRLSNNEELKNAVNKRIKKKKNT